MKGYECYFILKYPPIVLAGINNYIFKTHFHRFERSQMKHNSLDF
jgi:hypothetical protein